MQASGLFTFMYKSFYICECIGLLMPHRFIDYIKVQFFERHVLEIQSITQTIGNYETSIISNIALLKLYQIPYQKL